MIEIALCDDEEYTHNIIDKLLHSYVYCGYPTNITHYYSAAELLKDNLKFDIILLDIEMPEMDGIQLVYELMRRNITNYKVIMLTAKGERYKEAFKINAYRFVTKPIIERELLEALDDTCKTVRKVREINLRYNGEVVSVNHYCIGYVESKRDYLNLYSTKRKFDINDSMNDFCNNMDNNVFVRCHKSYIVNMLFVKCIKDGFFVLNMKDDNGENIKIPIAKRRYKEVLNKYIDFDINGR